MTNLPLRRGVRSEGDAVPMPMEEAASLESTSGHAMSMCHFERSMGMGQHCTDVRVWVDRRENEGGFRWKVGASVSVPACGFGLLIAKMSTDFGGKCPRASVGVLKEEWKGKAGGPGLPTAEL